MSVRPPPLCNTTVFLQQVTFEHIPTLLTDTTDYTMQYEIIFYKFPEKPNDLLELSSIECDPKVFHQSYDKLTIDHTRSTVAVVQV
jgi:hypothetical protein